jgi:hypothetical protein
MPLDNYSQFPYRMGAGFPGDITRMTPAAIIEPKPTDPTNPPQFQGQALVLDATSGAARPVMAATEHIYGISVRGFPTQAPNAGGYYGAQGFGNVSPWLTAGQPQNAVDICRQGYIMVNVNGTTMSGGAVFVWAAASAAPHVQGGFEAAATAGSTIALPTSCTYQGQADGNGNVEIAFNIGLS